MKIFALVLLALLGVSHALPAQQVEVAGDASRNTRFIGDIIAAIIERITEFVPDPLTLEQTSLEVGLPVRTIFNIDLNVDGASLEGASNIIINRMDFGLLSNRLDMDISLPRIAISIGDSDLKVTVLGWDLDFSANNVNLVIVEPRIAGSIQFNVGIITGIFVREINLGFTLGDIQYEGEVKAFGIDMSSEIHLLLNDLLPTRLRELEDDINELVGIVAMEIVNQIL